MRFAMLRTPIGGPLAAGIAGVVLAVSAPAASSPPVAPAARDAIVGTWRGTSTCTNRKLAPACRDEVVVYRVTSASADTAHLAAFKIVGGEEQSMGELRFERRKGAASWWDSEFRNARVHVRWSFQVSDTILTGTLIDLPGGAILRKVRAVRSR